MGRMVSTIKRVPDCYAFTAVLGSAVVTFILKEYIVAETQSDAMRDLLEAAKDV